MMMMIMPNRHGFFVAGVCTEAIAVSRFLVVAVVVGVVVVPFVTVQGYRLHSSCCTCCYHLTSLYPRVLSFPFSKFFFVFILCACYICHTVKVILDL